MSEQNITYIDHNQYDELVLNGDKVIVDFYSDECPPCEALAPKFESLAELYGQDIKFIKIFRQKNRELAETLGVKSSPTVLFYNQGKLVGDFLSGAVKRSAMMQNLDALISPQRVSEIHQAIKPKQTHCDILILGGGPGGLTAAIYAAQAKRKVILVDTALPGGQVSTTHLVSNYPGFIEAQHGYMLSHYMSEQALHAGTEYRVAVEVSEIDFKNKSLVVDGIETITAKKIIVSTGSSPRLLGLPGEVEYRGRGISYCATCDGKYYDDKEIIVIGGGNSAVEESLFLTQFASKITIIHQFDKLQANKTAQEQALAHPKINFKFEHEPRAFIKTEKGMDVVVENLKTHESQTLSADGVFIWVGMKPNLDGLGDAFELDEWGYIKTDALMHTNIPDVFAVGDVSSKPFRQITIAVSDGTIAAIQANKELPI
jgi:thioredoxin reductase (NADPH)